MPARRKIPEGFWVCLKPYPLRRLTNGGRVSVRPNYYLTGQGGSCKSTSASTSSVGILRMMSVAAVPAHVCSSIERQGEVCRNGKREKGTAVYALGSTWSACAAGYAEIA
jgi:hypothetical protein